jgi:membrane-bound lytic murein transglycosylase B
MRSSLGLTPLLLLAVALCAAPSRPATAAEDPAPPATVAHRVVRANPMMVEIRAVLDGERATLKTLHERFRAAKDPDAAIAIQREIARVKLDTEVAVLRVQAKHARAAGRADVATSLETAIQQILEPGAPPPATPRPTRTPTTEANTQR